MVRVSGLSCTMLTRAALPMFVLLQLLMLPGCIVASGETTAAWKPAALPAGGVAVPLWDGYSDPPLDAMNRPKRVKGEIDYRVTRLPGDPVVYDVEVLGGWFFAPRAGPYGVIPWVDYLAVCGGDRMGGGNLDYVGEATGAARVRFGRIAHWFVDCPGGVGRGQDLSGAVGVSIGPTDGGSEWALQNSGLAEPAVGSPGPGVDALPTQP
jgi:hypothetical protein